MDLGFVWWKNTTPFLSNSEPIPSWLDTVLPDFGRLNLDKYHMLFWHNAFCHPVSSDNPEGTCSEHHEPARKKQVLETCSLMQLLSCITPYLAEVRGNLWVHSDHLYLPTEKRDGCSPKTHMCTSAMLLSAWWMYVNGNEMQDWRMPVRETYPALVHLR